MLRYFVKFLLFCALLFFCCVDAFPQIQLGPATSTIAPDGRILSFQSARYEGKALFQVKDLEVMAPGIVMICVGNGTGFFLSSEREPSFVNEPSIASVWIRPDGFIIAWPADPEPVTTITLRSHSGSTDQIQTPSLIGTDFSAEIPVTTNWAAISLISSQLQPPLAAEQNSPLQSSKIDIVIPSNKTPLPSRAGAFRLVARSGGCDRALASGGWGQKPGHWLMATVGRGCVQKFV